MICSIRPLKAGASKHNANAMGPDIIPDALPQQFNHWLGAVGGEHAGAAELKKLQVRVARHQRGYVEFTLGVETVVCFGHVLAQQAIGADQRAAAHRDSAFGWCCARADDQEVVADCIEFIGVKALPPCSLARLGR